MASSVTPYQPPAEGSPAVHDSRSDWPVQATDTIVRLVDQVRDKTTGPALDASRWLIYGLVPALLSVPIAVLALAGLFRITEGALLWMHDQWAWADFLHDPIGFVYLTFGALFSFAGLVCWRKGKAPAPATVPA